MPSLERICAAVALAGVFVGLWLLSSPHENASVGVVQRHQVGGPCLRGPWLGGNDADATTRPGICADIREWDYRTYPPGHFDFIWASPVCTEFSRALTRRPRRLEDGDCLVLKTIEIIGYLRPRWWAV